METYGHTGRVAIVDLSRNAVTIEPTSEYRLDDYLGGRGLAHVLLEAHMPSGADPLGPDNVVVLAPGGLVGTNVPGAGRWAVAARSPLTGIIGSGNAGGFFGVALKWAGFDAVAVKGRADRPCYLHVRDGEITIEPADGLWGLDTREVVPAIRAAHGDPRLRVAAIGPAGEKLVPMANVIGEERAGGRGGVGAVMGSKNLKAVAAHGTLGVRVADADRLNSLVIEIVSKLRTEKAFGNYRKFGSAGVVKNRYGPLGGLMPFNGQRGVYPYLEEVNGNVLAERYVVRSHSCTACPIGCLKVFGVTEGPHAPTWGEGAQAATMISFGARCVMTNLPAALKAHALVNQYGLDLISVDGVIAFAFECFEKGVITTKDTGGLDLTWGNDDAVLKLIELMGRREGFGELLGLGTRELAKRWGGPVAERAALHVKGLEMTPVDPRSFPAWGLMMAVSSRGADHMRGYCLTEFGEFPEEVVTRLAGTPRANERFAVEGKGRLVARFEEVRALADCLGLCKWVARGVIYGFPEHMTEVLEAVFGRRVDARSLWLVGERLMNAERLFNLRHGLKPSDDTLPARVLEEPLPDGPVAGRVADLEPMLAEYYSARSWSRETGWPSPEKLNELGLAGS